MSTKGYGWPPPMDTSSNLPDQPSGCRRHGCLIAVVVVITLFVVGAMLLYHAVVGTSMPYRMVARMIEKANPTVRIEGITGNIKTGLGVSSITWGDVPGSPSEIIDLRVRYNGYGDAGKTRRLIINDVGVRRAHIDLADLPSSSSVNTTQSTVVTNTGTTTYTTTTTSGSSHITTTGPAFPSGASNTNFPSNLDSIEVERVSIEDVLITNRNAPEFRISIPKIEWTGFKATPTTFDPGVLTVESDRLTVHTNPGRTVAVDGETVTFQKSFTGAAQPALHPALKQPVAFTADASFVPQGADMRPFHFVAADGKLEINETKDGGGSVHARQLDLAGLLDSRKIYGDQAADLPGDLVLDALITPGFEDETGSFKIVQGSFRLGASKFEIQPVEFTKAGQEHTTLQATAKTDAGNVTWTLPLAKVGEEYHPRLIAQGMPQQEVLAHVFAGRSYDQLNEDEKKAIDARVPVYFPTVEK